MSLPIEMMLLQQFSLETASEIITREHVPKCRSFDRFLREMKDYARMFREQEAQ